MKKRYGMIYVDMDDEGHGSLKNEKKLILLVSKGYKKQWRKFRIRKKSIFLFL